MSRHMDSHQQKCKDCSFKCSNGRSLEVHRKAEHMFKCKKCKATLATKEALETHTTVAHMFKCQKCGTLFELKILLEKHFRALHMFKCPSCPQVQSICSPYILLIVCGNFHLFKLPIFVSFDGLMPPFRSWTASLPWQAMKRQIISPAR